MNKKKIYLFLGAPCIGKTTQGLILKQENFDHFSAGELLRKKYPSNTEIGKKLKNGEMVAVELINEILIESIQNSDKENIIIDGYPRTIEQSLFIKNNSIENINFKCIFYFFVDNINVLTNRLILREYCQLCGATYTKPINCCNIQTIKRNDDNIEIFEKRYNIFNSDIDYIIRNINLPVCFINSNNTIENINQDIKNYIKLFN